MGNGIGKVFDGGDAAVEAIIEIFIDGGEVGGEDGGTQDQGFDDDAWTGFGGGEGDEEVGLFDVEVGVAFGAEEDDAVGDIVEGDVFLDGGLFIAIAYDEPEEIEASGFQLAGDGGDEGEAFFGAETADGE